MEPTNKTEARLGGRFGVSTFIRLAALPLTLIVIAGGYWWFLRPQFAELRALPSKASLEREVQDLELRTSVLDASREQFDAQINAQRAVIDAAVPPSEEVPQLFSLIDAAAQRSGVVVTSMEVSREDAPDGLASVLRGNQVLVLGLAVRSVDYERLKAFLSVLEASQRLLDVLSVQFSPQSLTASVRVRSYTVE